MFCSPVLAAARRRRPAAALTAASPFRPRRRASVFCAGDDATGAKGARSVCLPFSCTAVVLWADIFHF
jgi:hypothetical protein